MPATTTSPSSTRRPRPSSMVAVVDAIRRAILANELAPGQRLVEAELCSLLGTSRGTVRAALLDLEHEGLVERIANRGARVRIVGLEEALDIAEVRLSVETLCVVRAAERITDGEIAELRQLAEELKKRAAEHDVGGFAEATNQVFRTYVRIADQPVAMEMLERLRDRNSRHRFRLTYRQGRAQVSLPYWLAIIDAICNRDADAAREALRRHSQNIQDTMRSMMEETPLSMARQPLPQSEP